MGRDSYEIFSTHWQAQTSEADGSGGDVIDDRLDTLPKYVASTMPTAPLTWNSSLNVGDVAEEVARLKQQPGSDILMYGCGQLRANPAGE